MQLERSYTLNYNIVWMDPRSPQYKLLEPSSDRGGILQDGTRPIEKMCSGRMGVLSSVTPSPLDPTTDWSYFGFYHVSHGSAERENELEFYLRRPDTLQTDSKRQTVIYLH